MMMLESETTKKLAVNEEAKEQAKEKKWGFGGLKVSPR